MFKGILATVALLGMFAIVETEIGETNQAYEAAIASFSGETPQGQALAQLSGSGNGSADGSSQASAADDWSADGWGQDDE